MKTLIIEYKVSSLFSKKSKKHYLSDIIIKEWDNQIHDKKYMISEKESDSILINWKFNLDSIYRKK